MNNTLVLVRAQTLLAGGTAGLLPMIRCLVCALVLAIAPSLCRAADAGTAFTYKGQLSVLGTPADGAYDLIFGL